MELRQYLHLIWKWIWLIAISVVIAASASYYASRSATPLYRTQATLMVGRAIEDPNPTSYELYTGQQLANTYIELVKREPVINGAIEQLGLDMDWRSLAGRVSARLIPDTQLIEVSVIDTDPVRAKVLADTVAEQLVLQTPANTSDIGAEIAGFSQTQLNELKTKIENAQDEILLQKIELDAANSARQIDSLQNKINLLEAKISDWQKTYSTLLATIRGGDINALRIVEEASIPTLPFSPKVLTNVLTASAIGFVLAVGGAFLIEYLDDSVKSPEDVERITKLPTIGGIARIEGEDYSEKLVTANAPMLPISEAFRVLRTNLQFSFVDKPPNSISVTSPGPTEGKSINLANLAVVMAQSGRKVIIVDTDLRRPVQHRIFNLPNRYGLSDVVLDTKVSVSEQVQETSIENLYLLSSGALPPNPTELLGSSRMKAIIGDLESDFDLVIFDSPPVLVVADAVILGSYMDGVIIISDVGRTRSAELKRSVEELQRGRANVVGVVLNRVSSRGSGYYYNHHYYYHYYGEDGDQQRKGWRVNGRVLKLPSLSLPFLRTKDEAESVEYKDETS
ncbi:MAG: polysaccharide biosynthesis tyrosine autokinase [Anaerolineales bacterium]